MIKLDFNLKRLINQLAQKRYLDIVLIVFSALIGFYLNWALVNIGVFCLAIFYLVRPFPSLVFIKLGLVSLLAIPTLLVIHRPEVATTFAIVTFYLLGLIIIAKIYEMMRKN